jgi:Flp pilus assembly protein TadG
MNIQLRRFFGREEEGGQALVLFAIVMLALLFAVGLAIDAGQLYSAKRTEQEAADAAAFAGAVVIYQGGTSAQAISAARTDAQTNGYSGNCPLTQAGSCYDAATLTTVTVNQPPLSGAYVGNSTHIEVEITRQVQTSLVPAEAAFNPVRARGVAGAEALNNGYAIMALDRGNSCNSFQASANADVHLNGGGILVNSGSGCAADNDQNVAARFTVEDPYTLDVHGQATGYWASVGVDVNAGYPQVEDPFAGWPRPDPAALGLPTCNSLVACQDVLGNQNPGVYTVTLGGSGLTDMVLNPGIYILTEGLDTAGNANVIGANVFLFNTYNTYPAAAGANPDCEQVNLQGNSSLTVSAMVTGTWANMMLYQDPACDTEVKIGGNGNVDGTGSVYIPNGPFVFDGNNATLHGSQLVSQTVNVQNGNITIDYDPNITAQPILPRLAE